MTPALRWAAMRAILMFHYLWGTQSQDSVHKPQPFSVFEEKEEPKWNQTEALPLTSLTPYCEAKPAHLFHPVESVIS